jgi:hypothetical protein
MDVLAGVDKSKRTKNIFNKLDVFFEQIYYYL